MISPAQREQRRAAGKKSGVSRSGRLNVDAPNVIAPRRISQSEADVDAAIARYVEIIGEPTGWTEVKALEQTRAEIYRTRTAAREDEIARGQLFTRDQIATRDESLALIFREQIRSVTDLIAAHVPPERVNAAQHAAVEWADRVLTAVADAIDGMGK